MKQPLITLTSDFGVQSQGIGIMEGVIFEINPDAKVIHLMHGLPDFNLSYAARALETANYLPVGCHACVVDPGVGTKRMPIIIETKRGDFLVGPDNGILIPGARFLGGIKKAVEITNKKYMRQPVSPIFHGRDVFAPAAAYLSKGVKPEEFGKDLSARELAKAPYEEAVFDDGKIKAKIISINKFGSLHLNITHMSWNKFNVKLNEAVNLKFKSKPVNMPFAVTFGDVRKGSPLILKDDYGRIQISLNQGSFEKKYKVKIGDEVIITK
ncbi:SAM-dependent chlorinase/fluorinase [Candidatus Woesearchaeota archaeon]|nr:SAM-dependent chlorinase/fluorinase [Candidatus Woesearchaeota archaeon]